MLLKIKKLSGEIKALHKRDQNDFLEHKNHDQLKMLNWTLSN